MFILGIKAPGISTVRDYYSRYTDAEVSLSYSFFLHKNRHITVIEVKLSIACQDQMSNDSSI